MGAAGVNFADVQQSRGTYEGGPKAPHTAGFEAAGELVTAAPDVENPLPLGTHVVGVGAGAFAQYMTMRAADVLPAPSGWSDAESLGLALRMTRLALGQGWRQSTGAGSEPCAIMFA